MNIKPNIARLDQSNHEIYREVGAEPTLIIRKLKNGASALVRPGNCVVLADTMMTRKCIVRRKQVVKVINPFLNYSIRYMLCHRKSQQST